MAAKRKNNGLGPGKLCKNICQVGFTKSEFAKFQKLQDMMDGTAGYVAGKAINDLARRKGL